ncbi:hypothetical protein LJC63_05135 [Ruminococcaceae bacterium OttesenSCG-928-L11]|nr:hypothetical protein [Ruminococcaceae bacterium OttesenSCG-928-L11]
MQYPVRAVGGMYGAENGKSLEGTVRLQISGRGRAATLSVAFLGQYKVECDLHALERLADLARQQLGSPGSGSTVEKAGQLEGVCADDAGNRMRGAINAWIRTTGSFEMLTISFEQRGQISVPFRAVRELAAQYRRTLV